MKAAMHGKITAVVVAAMIGMAVTGGSALARGGGGFGGGHIGGFGGAHMGVIGGPHVGVLGVGHIGGLGIHLRGAPGVALDRSLDDRGLGHTHISHELGHRHFRGLYGVSPLYDNNDCPWSTDLTIENCPVGSVTE
jgi:hypothetical protein